MKKITISLLVSCLATGLIISSIHAGSTVIAIKNPPNFPTEPQPDMWGCGLQVTPILRKGLICLYWIDSSGHSESWDGIYPLLVRGGSHLVIEYDETICFPADQVCIVGAFGCKGKTSFFTLSLNANSRAMRWNTFIDCGHCRGGVITPGTAVICDNPN